MKTLLQLLRKLSTRKPLRHYPSHWDGHQVTCKCGHHSAWDWDLRKHFEETGRVGS